MSEVLRNDPVIIFLGAIFAAYVVVQIVVFTFIFITENYPEIMFNTIRLLKKSYYNHKYDLQRKLNQMDDIESHYIVTKHNICMMIETITTAIINYKKVDSDEYAEVLITLIKIHEIMERYLSKIIDNAPEYSTSDLRYIYANVERFCEYMSNEWYLNKMREIDTKVIELEIECIPHFITLSKNIQTIISIDKSDDLLQLIKKEIPLDEVA